PQPKRPGSSHPRSHGESQTPSSGRREHGEECRVYREALGADQRAGKKSGARAPPVRRRRSAAKYRETVSLVCCAFGLTGAARSSREGTKGAILPADPPRAGRWPKSPPSKSVRRYEGRSKYGLRHPKPARATPPITHAAGTSVDGAARRRSQSIVSNEPVFPQTCEVASSKESLL